MIMHRSFHSLRGAIDHAIGIVKTKQHEDESAKGTSRSTPAARTSRRTR